MTERFFYTIHTPYEWSSGPSMMTLDENFGPIKSLERAKELADAKAGHHENFGKTIFYTTTYGVEYID